MLHPAVKKVKPTPLYVDIESVICIIMGAIMGHTTNDLASKDGTSLPYKDYATHVPVTTLLFVDELHTRLNHI